MNLHQAQAEAHLINLGLAPGDDLPRHLGPIAHRVRYEHAEKLAHQIKLNLPRLRRCEGCGDGTGEDTMCQLYVLTFDDSVIDRQMLTYYCDECSYTAEHHGAEYCFLSIQLAAI